MTKEQMEQFLGQIITVAEKNMPEHIKQRKRQIAATALLGRKTVLKELDSVCDKMLAGDDSQQERLQILLEAAQADKECYRLERYLQQFITPTK